MNFDRPIVRFFLSSIWPLVIVFLFLSIGLNAVFLLLDRYHSLPTSLQSTSIAVSVLSDDSFARGPEAFGTVARGFPQKSQGSVKDFTPPVRSYSRGVVPLPVVPPTMTLYRDQGFEVDRVLVDQVFAGLRAPVQSSSLPLFTRSFTLRSIDFSRSITLDAERRILTVIESATSSSVPTSVLADDIEVIAIAKEYAQSLGIDVEPFGAPLVKNVRDQQGAEKTMVLWTAVFDGLPLVDTDLEPIDRLAIQVGRVSRRALSARLNLLQPRSLVRSAYPTSSASSIDLALASGGLLPVARNLSGAPVTADFSSLDLAYMVIPPDHEFPLYIVPVVRAEWSMKPTCKGCVPVVFSTFVPALDASMFQWVRSVAPSVASSASIASSASTPAVSSLSSASAR